MTGVQTCALPISYDSVDYLSLHTYYGNRDGDLASFLAQPDNMSDFIKEAAALCDAVKATKTYRTPPYPSTHNMGTNRMSENARDGVVNKHGQTHDIANLFISDGSQFTTGGAENPTLTIVTLAIRQADYIAQQMTARAL